MATRSEKMLERIDERTIAIKMDLAEIKERLDNHSKRIGGLEKWRTFVVGVTSAILLTLGIK